MNMATGKIKVNYKAQNKTSINPKIKNQTNRHEIGLTKLDTTQKTRTQVFKLLTPLTLTEKKNVYLHGFKEHYIPRNINILFGQCGS
jgi:hypothetical protein